MRQNGGFPPFGEPGGMPPLALPANAGSLLKWGVVFFAIVLAIFGINFARNVYTDWLWFSSVGFLDVLTTVLGAKVLLFLAGAAAFGLFLGANLWVVRRSSRGESVLPLPAETIQWLDRFLLLSMVLGAIVISIFFGVSASSHWEPVLRLANSTPFGVADPVFNKDIAFYVFTYPVLRFIQGWLLTAFLVALFVVAVTYLAHAAFRGAPLGVPPRMRAHLAVLGALAFFALAGSHFFDRYHLLFSKNGAVVGATYADVHARMVMLVLIAALAVAAGAMLLATISPRLQGRRGNRLIIGAIGLWLGGLFLGGQLYPAAVQRITVEPNELEKERPYIERNIQLTRAAFALDRIEERSYDYQEANLEDINANEETVRNVRLWDPRPLMDTYNQIQHLRLYYQFGDVDVDRYVVDGRYRQVLVGARELAPENLPADARNWVNLRLQYTHGYGAAASPVTEFTAEGRPTFLVQDIPPAGKLAVTRPEIYFGENTEGYVIANSQQPEFDHPTQEDLPVYVQYQGQGGVALSSFARRLAYAWQFADINLLISDRVSPESKLQYRRQIQERIAVVAPFLMLDRDPYLVIAEDGRLVWIQDAYTISDRYPYSVSFTSAFSGDTFNYVRNSVKIVTDAYHGTIDFYIADPTDPVVRSYAGIFPTLFKPLEEMPQDLRAHLRYPEDMFTFQAQSYLKYHVTDATRFFNNEDLWSIPLEIFGSEQQPVVPYYVIMRLPGETKPEFVLILPFTPLEKPNMVGWLSARMDGEHYGKLLAFRFPGGAQIDGPIQIEARINNDTIISQQFTLWNQQGSQVIRGNLLVIPLGDSVLYVEPIYLQSEGVRLPELKRVILATSRRVVMEPSLDVALGSLFGRVTPTEPTGPGAQPPPGTEEAAQQLENIRKALRDLQQGITTLDEAIQRLSQLLAQEAAQTPTPTPTPAPRAAA
ncbi:MAG: UPF0182 family protein [Chloroflexi bacterium]|nr:UPF0182 family protein [Chloroflexota bacterium]